LCDCPKVRLLKYQKKTKGLSDKDRLEEEEVYIVYYTIIYSKMYVNKNLQNEKVIFLNV
jgi:hypothetical protein